MLAQILHERGVDPQHKGGKGFSGVMRRPTSRAHLELYSFRRRGVRTQGQDILGAVVVLPSMVVV